MIVFFQPRQPARILGTGSYLPGPTIDNASLIARTGLKLTPEWIERHTGIRARHWAEPGITTTDVAAIAARMALESAGCSARDMELLVLATISGDWPTPATACAVQARIGAVCPAYDLNSACAGFLFALEHAMRGFDTGLGHALIMGAELRSRFINMHDRRTAPIFGDGAGAAILGMAQRPAEGFLGILLETEGAEEQLVTVPAGGVAEPPTADTVAAGRHYITIRDAAELTRRGVDAMCDLVAKACNVMRVALGDIDLVIPHQANQLMLDRIFDRLGVPASRRLVTIGETGNTVAASIPIALDRARRTSPCWRPGALVALATLGGGYSGGVAFYRIPETETTP